MFMMWLSDRETKAGPPTHIKQIFTTYIGISIKNLLVYKSYQANLSTEHALISS